MDETRTKTLLVAGVLALWAAVTPLMWRDLHRRTSAEVRGPKWLWWIASANLSGSAAYWLFGRRRGSSARSAGSSTS
jgi:hypothetical protein